MNSKQLAKELNVSESTLMRLVEIVGEAIVSDHAVDAFAEMNEDEQNDMCLAYTAHVVKKLRDFHMTYITKPNFKKSFDDYVYEKLAGKK